MDQGGVLLSRAYDGLVRYLGSLCRKGAGKRDTRLVGLAGEGAGCGMAAGCFEGSFKGQISGNQLGTGESVHRRRQTDR